MKIKFLQMSSLDFATGIRLVAPTVRPDGVSADGKTECTLWLAAAWQRDLNNREEDKQPVFISEWESLEISKFILRIISAN